MAADMMNGLVSAKGSSDMRDARNSIIAVAYAIGLLVILISISYVSLDMSGSGVDDAFIVYRYADRFLEGNGLTFNDGEYVEGFTSLI